MKDFKHRVKEAVDTLSFTDFPDQIIIETIAGCNLKCPACPSRSLKRPRGLMDDSIYKKIINEAARENIETEIYPAYMGEPLLDEKLFQRIEYAKKKGLKKIYLNSNGMLITKSAGKKLMESGVNRIILSIDGFSRESFEKTRVGAKYDIVKKNTMDLLELKNAYSTEIWVQMIINDHNVHEENSYIKYWTDKGAIVKIRPQLTWGGKIETNYLAKVELKRVPCPWLLRQIVITWNGEVSMCDADHEAASNIGNVTHQSIKSIWNSSFKKLREAHVNKDFSHPLCINCHDWKVGKSEVHYPETYKY